MQAHTPSQWRKGTLYVLCILVTSAPLVAITGKKKGAHSLSVLPTEALRKPYPVTGGNAPRGRAPFSGPDNEISQVSVGPLKLKRLKRLSCLRAVYQIPWDASTGHAAAAKHSTGRHSTRHSLGSGVLAFRGDRAFPVLILHIRRKVAESPSCREIFSSPLREFSGKKMTVDALERRLPFRRCGPSMGFLPHDAPRAPRLLFIPPTELV